MKKQILIILVFSFSLLSQAIYSQAPSYIPTIGLVGYWPFNGDANDESGNGNNGIVNGASLTTDRFGNNNCAYYFNGVDNFITINNSPSLNISGNQISISVWLQTEDNCSTAYGQKGISKGGWDVGNGYELLYGSCGGFQLSGNHGGFQSVGSYNNGNWNGNWTHIVAVFNNGTGIIYVNGQAISSNLNGSQFTSFLSSTAPLYFGKRSPGNQTIGFVKGKMDDIGIWNRALTQQEITEMYNGVNYSDTCNAVSGSLVNGLVGYWPFCGNANDQSGNGNNGTVSGAILTTDRFGNNNSAFNFDGSTSFIQINDNPLLDLTNDFTISSWFNSNSYPTSVSTYQMILAKHRYNINNAGSYIYGLWSNVNSNGFINFQATPVFNPTTYPSNSNYTIGNWYNYVISYSKSSNTLKYYLNGVLIDSKNISFTIQDTNYNLIIGASLNTSDDSKVMYFNGKIDDVGIWNRTLTQQEITQLYNQNQCITNISVTDTLIINVGQLSYTNPVAYSNNITIYPNPANTQVNISFNNITDLSGGHINIINSLGQQVATAPITASGTNTIMPLNSWGGTGLYFVQIENNQGIVVEVKKIILQ